MIGWTRYRDNILSKVGAMNKQVVVVEGGGDQTFIESLLTRRSPGGWEPNWVIGLAGSKSHLLHMLNDQPRWLGLVDRDEWTGADVSKNEAKYSQRLFVLPRYCIESYFTVPSELWALLERTQQEGFAGGQAAFEAALTMDVHKWIRHGALWRAVNPLWKGIRALGFKDDLLAFAAAQQSDDDIEAKLGQWHSHLDPNAIMGSFRANLATAAAAPLFDQLTQWVHGKRYFREFITPTIPQLVGVPKTSAEKLLANLQRNMNLPADLQPIWNAVRLP